MQEPQEITILKRDTNSISRVCREMDIVCSLINDAISKLNAECLLVVEINDALMRSLNANNPAAVITALSEAYKTESEKFQLPIARKDFASNAEKSASRVTEIFAELAQAINKECAKHLLFNDVLLRSEFLFADNGNATYNVDAVTEYYTVYSDNDAVTEYINKAKQLHKLMADFDRQTYLLSRGTTRGITDDSDGIIEVVDGVIWLDLTRVENLDFANAEKLLKSPKKYDNAKVADVAKMNPKT